MTSARRREGPQSERERGGTGGFRLQHRINQKGKTLYLCFRYFWFAGQRICYFAQLDLENKISSKRKAPAFLSRFLET